MLISKIIRGYTVFRKIDVDCNVCSMAIIGSDNTVHVQNRRLCGEIEYEERIPLVDRKQALAFIKGFFDIPVTV